MVPWCFGVSRVYSPMEINMGAGDNSTGGVVPIPSEVLVVAAENMLVAKFAVSRWYSAHGSLTFGRQIRKECIQAAALRG